MNCIECRAKLIEIETLRSSVDFYKRESAAWRKLWHDVKCGEPFNIIQRELAVVSGKYAALIAAKDKALAGFKQEHELHYDHHQSLCGGFDDHCHCCELIKELEDMKH